MIAFIVQLLSMNAFIQEINMSLSNNISHHPGRINGSKSADVSQEILRAVEELKQGSGFGSIEIVLHEGRVTQIEKREKLRFSHNTNPDTTKK